MALFRTDITCESILLGPAFNLAKCRLTKVIVVRIGLCRPLLHIVLCLSVNLFLSKSRPIMRLSSHIQRARHLSRLSLAAWVCDLLTHLH